MSASSGEAFHPVCAPTDPPTRPGRRPYANAVLAIPNVALATAHEGGSGEPAVAARTYRFPLRNRHVGGYAATGMYVRLAAAAPRVRVAFTGNCRRRGRP